MKKNSNKLFVLVAVVGIVMIMIAAVSVKNPKTIDASDYVYSSYKIQPGDTLWDIAKEHKLPDDDIREMIDAIMHINNLKTENIQSGKYLTVMKPIQ